ncbi:MAG: YraN family protein [Synergistaceae bacterium]|nr:YraN family protein [Synergistaceae bacterium]
MNHLEFGAEGERIAAGYIERMGWRVLGRNIRIGRGELDITAMDGDELVIVEVRTRRLGMLLPAEMSVGPQKLRKTISTARKYIQKISYEGNWRIDIVAVTENRDGSRKVELYSNVTMGMEGGFMG